MQKNFIPCKITNVKKLCQLFHIFIGKKHYLCNRIEKLQSRVCKINENQLTKINTDEAFYG